MSIYKLASEIIKRQNKENRDVSNLQIQKLTYFCYAIALGKNDISIINTPNPFEAWDYGPVNPDLYYSFRSFGSNPIPLEIAEAYANLYDGTTKLDLEDSQIIDFVLKKIGMATATQLVELSHTPGSPWDTIYKKNKGGIILDKEVSTYFNMEK